MTIEGIKKQAEAQGLQVEVRGDRVVVKNPTRQAIDFQLEVEASLPYHILFYRKTHQSDWKFKDGTREELYTYAEAIEDKVYEVRLMEARMIARWGPLDAGGAMVVSQTRFDEGALKKSTRGGI